MATLFVEFRVYEEFEQGFLRATRTFELTAKAVPGLRRIELFKRADPRRARRASSLGQLR